MENMSLSWAGIMTAENIEGVAEQLRQLLTGKRYTFVLSTEDTGFEPKVSTNRRLTPNDDGDSIIVYPHGEFFHSSIASQSCIFL